MTPDENTNNEGVGQVTEIDAVKALRSKIQANVDFIDTLTQSRETSLARTKLQEGKMWLGQHLGALGEKDLNAERDNQNN